MIEEAAVISTDYDNSPQYGQDAGPCKWTPEEDKLLLAAVENFGIGNWKEISKVVGTKNNVQCGNRYMRYTNPALRKGPWSVEEDATLIIIMSTHGLKWTRVAELMKTRSDKQCRERWIHHLNPAVDKSDYSRDEDKKILQLHAELGNKWAAIAKELPGRTELNVKERCIALRRREESGGSRIRNRKRKLRNALDPEIEEVGKSILALRK